MIGERLKEAREVVGLTQLKLIFDISMSCAVIGIAEIEKRKMSRALMPKVLERRNVEGMAG